MKKFWLRFIGISFFVFLLATLDWAQTSFQVKKMTRTDVPKGQGQCDLRLEVDSQAEISLQGDLVNIRNINGKGGRDVGCECNLPLPSWNLQGFNFQVIEARGKLELVEEPSLRNGFRAVFGVSDPQAGMGRYRIRITWNEATSGGTPPAQNRGSNSDQWRSGSSWSRPGNLRILSALYGVPGYYQDVTPVLQRLMQNDRIYIQVTNENMGGDPAPHAKKELVVFYEYRSGGVQSVWLWEGDSLDIPNSGGR